MDLTTQQARDVELHDRVATIMLKGFEPQSTHVRCWQCSHRLKP